MSDPAEKVAMFMSVTNSSKEVAEGFIGMAGGDVQEAISLYMDNPEAAPPAVEASPKPKAQPKATAAPTVAVPTDSIDSILKEARQAGDREDEEKKWGSGTRLDGNTQEEGSGKGKGKGKDDRTIQNVAIMFFADGFLIDDNAEAQDEDDEDEVTPAPKAAPRRTGMMSLSDLAPARGKGGGKGKKLPKIPDFGPLRSYDTADNKKFLDDVKQGLVPQELRKLDDQGKPVGTSIMVSDMRPMPSAKFLETIEELKKLKAEQDKEESSSQGGSKVASNMFAGAGHTLSASSHSSTSQANASSATSGGGSADPALIALVTGKAAPTADESRPVTTLQLRLSTGARIKVRLNLEHTVADLWRVVAENLGQTVFASSSGHELSAGFPPKPLRDASATLQAADLANASVTHRCSPAA